MASRCVRPVKLHAPAVVSKVDTGRLPRRERAARGFGQLGQHQHGRAILLHLRDEPGAAAVRRVAEQVGLLAVGEDDFVTGRVVLQALQSVGYGLCCRHHGLNSTR
jgi:hypothetical protein